MTNEHKSLDFTPTPMITVKEARKILGKAYKNYPDESIERLIKNLDSIVEAYIKTVPKY